MNVILFALLMLNINHPSNTLSATQKDLCLTGPDLWWDRVNSTVRINRTTEISYDEITVNLNSKDITRKAVEVCA